MHKLRENLPPTDDQALASAMNAHAARTVCVLNALSASVEARLAEAARGVAEAEARTRLLERALDAEVGETTTRAADARVEAVSSAEGGGVDAVAVGRRRRRRRRRRRNRQRNRRNRRRRRRTRW